MELVNRSFREPGQSFCTSAIRTYWAPRMYNIHSRNPSLGPTSLVNALCWPDRLLSRFLQYPSAEQGYHVESTERKL